MLAGVKLIPRDQLILQKPNPALDESDAEEQEYSRKGEKERGKHRIRRKGKKKSRHDSSNEEENRQSESRWKRKSSKRDSSDDDSSPSSDKEKRSKRRRNRKEAASSVGLDSSDDEYVKKSGRRKDGKDSIKKKDKMKSKDSDDFSDECGEVLPQNDPELTRKEIGLEWMLSSGKKRDNNDGNMESQLEESQVPEVTKTNPKELNPYLKDNGSGYPDEDDPLSGAKSDQLLPSSVVGDGGASWRLKALKRAKEQATREGRKLDEVVEERWGSLGQLARSVAVHRAAPAHSHLNAIRGRKMGRVENSEIITGTDTKRGVEEVAHASRDYLRDVSTSHPQMRKPKQDSLPWRKNKGAGTSSENASLISSAISSLNKFSNDGSFMDEITHLQNKDAGSSNSYPHAKKEADVRKEKELVSSKTKYASDLSSVNSQGLTANQLAAKVLQLRMKGKHEEAEKLSREMESMVEKQDPGTQLIGEEIDGSTRRYTERKISGEQRQREDDADLHLARKIMQNRQYSLSGRADDEYDFDDAPSRKHNRKRGAITEERRKIPARILTQHERCQFCFENPSRPKHLVVAIGNFTYMMLPQWQLVVQGHCCILPMQHESATRSVDNNIWEEIRNFKKCLIRMFAKQDKDVVFLETVIGLAQQRRHCLVECIPVPYERSKQAPLYFKKAIDEAEEEWGQHEMKKLIQTSGNLRHVIPENFSYFHVEFGLDKGFVHVIDDDSNFKYGFGVNVIRGLLRLPEEDMYRRQRHEPVEKQKVAVATFAQEWEPFDWTKQLK